MNLRPEFSASLKTSNEEIISERERVQVALRAAKTILGSDDFGVTFDYKLAARAMFGAIEFDPLNVLDSNDERDSAAAECFNQALKLESPEHAGSAILIATSKEIRIGRLATHLQGIFQPIQFSFFGANHYEQSKSEPGDDYFGWFAGTRIKAQEVVEDTSGALKIQNATDLVANLVFTSFSFVKTPKLRADYVGGKSDSILVGKEIDLIFDELTDTEKAKVEHILSYQEDTSGAEFKGVAK